MTGWADWSDTDNGLTALFGDLLSIPCDWADRPRNLRLQTRAQAQVISNPVQGQPDRTYQDVDGDLVETVREQRSLVVQVSVFSLKNELSQAATAFLQRLRTRLAMDSSLERLALLRLSLERIENPVPLRTTEDGRTVSRWAMDIHFGYQWSETDDDNPISTIEDTRIASLTSGTEDPALLSVDGAALDDDLQIDINTSE